MTLINRLLTSQQAFMLRLATGAIFGLVIANLNANIAGSSRLPNPEIWRETLSVTLALLAFVIWAGAGAKCEHDDRGYTSGPSAGHADYQH